MKKYIGIDAGTRTSNICVISNDKKVLKELIVSNKQISKEIKAISGLKHCIIEAGPLSEFICEQVESTGATIDIVDSRHTKALLQGRKKTDKIDCRILAELAALGWYKPVYRKGSEAREQKVIVKGRGALVKSSVQIKNTIRGLLKAYGIVLPLTSEGSRFLKKAQESIADLDDEVKLIITDLLEVWNESYTRQRKSYVRITKLTNNNEITRKLMSVPGVGPATALSFAATVVNPKRFSDGKQLAGYLGLAPKVHQSGDTHFHGRITKQGDKSARWHLVESAHIILTRVKEDFPLRSWGLKLAEKKGFAKAKVAVARRLAIMLHAIWLNDSEFEMPLAA